MTNVLKVGEDSGLKSLQIIDLDRRVDVVEYSFYQPPGEMSLVENASLFDEVKFGAGGKLFFKIAPDFENKRFCFGEQYEIVVEARKKPAYQDQETQFDQKYIRVEVLPVNEPPEFTNLSAYLITKSILLRSLNRSRFSILNLMRVYLRRCRRVLFRESRWTGRRSF